MEKRDATHTKLNYPWIALYCKDYEDYLKLPYKALVGHGIRSMVRGEKPIEISLGIRKVDVEYPETVDGKVTVKDVEYDVVDESYIMIDDVKVSIMEAIAEEVEEVEKYYTDINGTLVHYDVDEETINKLNTKINTKSVYVEKKGYGEIAPNSVGCYMVYTDTQLASAGFVKAANGSYVKTGDEKRIIYKLKHIDETTINEVYQNNFKYVLDENNEYVKADDAVAKSKFVKGLIRTEVANEVGDPLERIADLSKLVYFLFNKCKTLLSEEEIAAAEFILTTDVDVNKLKELDGIERKVNKVVNKYKG